VEPAPPSDIGAREVRVVRDLRYPGGLAGGDDASRKTLAGRQDETLAQRFELPRARIGMPGANAAQPSIVGVDLPDGAQLPAERGSDHLQHGRIGIEWVFLLGEDPSDRMLDPLRARVPSSGTSRQSCRSFDCPTRKTTTAAYWPCWRCSVRQACLETEGRAL
jgi:hypothetical protein